MVPSRSKIASLGIGMHVAYQKVLNDVPGAGSLRSAAAACSVQAPARVLALPNLWFADALASGSRLAPRTRKKDYRMVILFSWFRGQDSNLRPRGYEPRELPLLHPGAFVRCYVFLKRKTDLSILSTSLESVNWRTGDAGRSLPMRGSAAPRLARPSCSGFASHYPSC